MTATNHALTGAIIGLSVHQPLVAIPLAFSAHYIMDGIPHFGGVWPKGSKAFEIYLIVEALLCFSIVAVLALTRPEYWLLGAICAFTTASPDFMWIREFLEARKGKEGKKPSYALARLHSKVQWFEKPIGLIVELAWAFATIAILANIIRR